MVQALFSIRFAILIKYVILAAFIWLPGGASALAQASKGWSLCNQTSYIIESAIARPFRESVRVDGWIRLRPGECRVAIEAPIKLGTYYLMSRSSSAHLGGRRYWEGSHQYCVDPLVSFSIESQKNCSAIGLEARKFRRIEIDAADEWITYFNETEPYDLKKAQAAGLQRLLNDAGVEETKVDGYLGRKSKRALANFRKKNSIASSVNQNALIDALELAGHSERVETGFLLCNRNSEVIWAALASVDDDKEVSRGWWQIEPESCSRLMDEIPTTGRYYLAAEKEQGNLSLGLVSADTPFCTTPTKFIINGSDNCYERAYRQTMFKEITLESGKKIMLDLQEDDFFSLIGGAGDSSSDKALFSDQETAGNE